jgi:hypothetical protein
MTFAQPTTSQAASDARIAQQPDDLMLAVRKVAV